MESNIELIQSFQRLHALPAGQDYWAFVKESRRVKLPLSRYRALYFEWRRQLAPGATVQPRLTLDRPDAAIGAAGISQQSCPQCGANPNQFEQQPGSGPHAAKLVCGNCSRFIKWLPKPRKLTSVEVKESV